eukprot:413591_1
MPKAYVHQSILSLHHPIWRSLHYHRSTLKTQTLAQSILSANTRQENVRTQNMDNKRKKVTKISHLVMNVVDDLSNSRIQWAPSGADLLNRMSTMMGSKIDLNEWFVEHQTMRASKINQRKMGLFIEAGGTKKMATKHNLNLSQKLNFEQASLHGTPSLNTNW